MQIPNNAIQTLREEFQKQYGKDFGLSDAQLERIGTACLELLRISLKSMEEYDTIRR